MQDRRAWRPLLHIFNTTRRSSPPRSGWSEDSSAGKLQPHYLPLNLSARNPTRPGEVAREPQVALAPHRWLLHLQNREEPDC